MDWLLVGNRIKKVVPASDVDVTEEDLAPEDFTIENDPDGWGEVAPENPDEMEIEAITNDNEDEEEVA